MTREFLAQHSGESSFRKIESIVFSVHTDRSGQNNGRVGAAVTFWEVATKFRDVDVDLDGDGDVAGLAMTRYSNRSSERSRGAEIVSSASLASAQDERAYLSAKLPASAGLFLGMNGTGKAGTDSKERGFSRWA